MKENIIKAFDQYQIAELDHDMIGICKSFVNWLKILQQEINGSVPVNEPPDNFYKLDPHLPRMELRTNIREFLAAATKRQKEDVELNTRLQNLYVAVLAATYAYHMPTDKIIEASSQDTEISRKECEEMLLANNMSPNWIKEPSGKDFSAIML